MIKLIFILTSSLWLSCGNTPNQQVHQTAEIKTDTLEEVITVDMSNDVVILSEHKEKDLSSEEVQIVEEPKAKEDVFQAEDTIEEKLEVLEEISTLPSHDTWHTLLKKYVNDKGDVDYNAFQKDVVELDEYLNYLAENSPTKDWSKNEKLAYYINLYNAATVKLILNNYPTKSIKDLKNPWGKSWVKTGDGKLSLGDIEHKILRKMNEPRIHFAINCASYSCPKLLNQAFTAANMEKRLEQVTNEFINDPSRNQIAVEKVMLSNIFKWYKKDFTENGSLIDYIKPYTQIAISRNTTINYLKYDWSLNEAK